MQKEEKADESPPAWKPALEFHAPDGVQSAVLKGGVGGSRTGSMPAKHLGKML